MVELKGFPSLEDERKGDEDSDGDMDTAKMVQEANRKKKKSGGFQSMGLSQEVWRGVIKKGYKVPTPIQRKTVQKTIVRMVNHQFQTCSSCMVATPRNMKMIVSEELDNIFIAYLIVV